MKIFYRLITITVLFLTTSALAGLPPENGKTRYVYLRNDTSAPITWEYHRSYGSCIASPRKKTDSGYSEDKTKVTCAFTADGYFTLTTTTNKPIGKLYAGFNGCEVITSNNPFHITSKSCHVQISRT